MFSIGSRIPFMALALIWITPTTAEPLYDPTRPPAGVLTAPAATAKASPEPLQLSFIKYADGQRLARINGQWVAEGERVAGAEVMRIDRDSVRLRQDGRVFSISLRSGSVHKRMLEPAS